MSINIFKKSSYAIGLLIVGFWVNTLHAAIVTDSSQIPDPYVINFDGAPETSGSGVGPLRVFNDYGIRIEVSGTPGTSGLYSRSGWGFGTNGVWVAGTHIGMSSTPPESIIVTFKDGPVAAAGVFTNYVPELGEFSSIAALDENMQVLEEYNLEEVAPIRVSGIGKPGAFRGISRQSNDIYHFRITGEDPVMDDLTFFQYTTPVNVVGSFSLSEFAQTGAYPVAPDPLEASFSVVVNINEVTAASNGTFSLLTVLDTISPNPLTVGTETFTADQISLRISRSGTEAGEEFNEISISLGIGEIGSTSARTNDFRTVFGALIDVSESTLPRTIDISPIESDSHRMVNKPINGGLKSPQLSRVL